MPGGVRTSQRRDWSRRWAAGLLLAALAVALSGCFGSGVNLRAGRLTGKATDLHSGAAVVKAVVTVDGVAYRPDGEGRYLTGTLSFGPHQVKAEAPGYAPQSVTVNLSLPTQVQSFTLDPVPDASPPSVVESYPANLSTGVYLDARIVLRFSEAMDQASVQAALKVAPATLLTFTWNGTQVTAASSPSWASGQTYTVTLDTGALDATGTALTAPFSFSFTTGTTTMPTSRVAFASNDQAGDPLQIFLLDPETRAATLLLTDSYGDEQPSWSPDGEWLVYLSYGGGSVPHLYVTRVDVPAPTALLPTSGYRDREPKWSPDGDRIAFSSNRDRVNPDRYNLWVVGIDPVTGRAGAVKQATMGEDCWDSTPDWAPADKVNHGVATKNLLVFSSAFREPGKRLIYAVDGEDTGGSLGEPAGSPVSLLTPSAVDLNAGEPAWSPDGTKIAYSAKQDGTQDIWVMDVTVSGTPGSRTVTAANHRRLSLDAAADAATDDQPVWSPDGKYLLFVRTPLSGGSSDLYWLDVNDPSATPALMAGGAGRQTNPAWSRR